MWNIMSGTPCNQLWKIQSTAKAPPGCQQYCPIWTKWGVLCIGYLAEQLLRTWQYSKNKLPSSPYESLLDANNSGKRFGSKRLPYGSVHSCSWHNAKLLRKDSRNSTNGQEGLYRVLWNLYRRYWQYNKFLVFCKLYHMKVFSRGKCRPLLFHKNSARFSSLRRLPYCNAYSGSGQNAKMLSKANHKYTNVQHGLEKKLQLSYSRGSRHNAIILRSDNHFSTNMRHSSWTVS